MKKIDGRCLDPYVGNPHETGVMLGRLLARLHLALGKIEGQVASYDADYMRELDEWIMPRIRENHVRVSPKTVEYCYSFGPLYKTLPRQLIHRDTHLGNMLFMGETLAGWLDFDMSQKNARLHDLCYMGACMLVGNYHKRRRLRIWRELFRGVLCGYNEILTLTENELKAASYMFVFIELTFTAFYAQTGDKGKAASCADMTAWLYRHKDKITSLAQI
jgi:Ser/Thr protein kinase RdoA (MazF antagonist)